MPLFRLPQSGRLRFVLLLLGFELLIFTLTRLFLAGISWPGIRSDISEIVPMLFTGLSYDFAYLAYFLGLPVIYIWVIPQKWWRHPLQRFLLTGFLTLVTCLAWFTVIAEYLFWQEFSTRFNFISVDYLIYTTEVIDNIVQSYPLWKIGGAVLAATVLTLAGFFRIGLMNWQEKPESCGWKIPLAAAVAVLLSFLLLGQGPRNQFVNNYLRELASNGPYQFWAAFRNNELDYNQFYATLPESDVDAILRTELAASNAEFISKAPMDIRRRITAEGPEKKWNVILLTVESLSAEFLEYFGNDRGLTPNLDALIRESLFFENFYSMGTRSVRGLEAMTLSIPATPGRAIVKRMGREKDHWALGRVLAEKGYRAYFVYGGRGFFENMNAFFDGNGYEIVDQTTVDKKAITFKTAWGMCDENLLDQVLALADRDHAAKQPFFQHVFTTSNHRPFTYPEGRIDIASGTGRDGAVKYTDYAIGRFFQQAWLKPWFENTLFLIVADHQASSAGREELPVNRYHIPFYVYAPSLIKPDKSAGLASQMDIAPTIMGLLNMSYLSCWYGKDLMRDKPGRAIISNYQKLGLYDQKNLSILETGRKIVGDSNSLLTRRCIAYFQGAAHVFKNRLDSWENRNMKTDAENRSAGTDGL